MDSGYAIRDGEEYFCSDECLWGWYSEEEYDELCHADEAYWTEWEEAPCGKTCSEWSDELLRR